MFRSPFRAGTAHVVLFGMIRFGRTDSGTGDPCQSIRGDGNNLPDRNNIEAGHILEIPLFAQHQRVLREFCDVVLG